jgi:hypothetical protein
VEIEMATVLPTRTNSAKREAQSAIGKGIGDFAQGIVQKILQDRERKDKEEKKEKLAAILRESFSDDKKNPADIIAAVMNVSDDPKDAALIADIVISGRREKEKAATRKTERTEDKAEARDLIGLRGDEARKTQAESKAKDFELEKQLIPQRAAAQGAQARETAGFKAGLDEQILQIRQQERKSALENTATQLEQMGDEFTANVLRNIGSGEPGLASTVLQTKASVQSSSRDVKGRDVEVFRKTDKGKVEERKITLRPGESVSTFDTDERFKELREAGFSPTKPAETDDPPELKKFERELENTVKATGLPEEGAAFFAENQKALASNILRFYGDFDADTKTVKFFEGGVGKAKARQALGLSTKAVKAMLSKGQAVSLPTVIANVTKAADNFWSKGLVIPANLRNSDTPGAKDKIIKFLAGNFDITTTEASSYVDRLIDRGILSVPE